MGETGAEIVVTCECGFEVRGAEDDVVERTQAHGREAHNMDVTRDQVLAMARGSGGVPPEEEQAGGS